MEKLTRQGVRDLNHIKGNSRGKKLEMPPQEFMCKHPKIRSIDNGYFEVCDDCGESFEVQW